MKKTLKKILSDKSKTVPILSFPSAGLLGISVRELISNSENQARGMEAILSHCDIGASLNMMDLSVEAEAFGADIHFCENEIPTVTKGVISSLSEAADLKVPEIGTGRTGIYISGVKLAKQRIKATPVFCGVIGPYSLAGRIYDMTSLMMDCFDDPDGVEILLDKCTQFIIEYIKAFKAVGADGVILAEPAAGILSPDLARDFSCKYVKRIIDETADGEFIFAYHNCGGAVVDMAEDLAALNADIYHFGNAIKLSDIIELIPESSVVMGNIDPVMFKAGTPNGIKKKTTEIYNECSRFPNFMLSSGCDIPYDSKWENIDAYFSTVKELYK